MTSPLYVVDLPCGESMAIRADSQAELAELASLVFCPKHQTGPAQPAALALELWVERDAERQARAARRMRR